MSSSAASRITPASAKPIPDVNVALRDAFKTAERRLTEFKRKQRGDVKVHEDDAFFAGQVSQLYPDEDHGFLLTHEGTQLYFHRNSLMQRDFDELQGRRPRAFRADDRRHRPDREQGVAGRGRAGLAAHGRDTAGWRAPAARRPSWPSSQ